MSEQGGTRRERAHAIGKKGRKSLGVAILARTLADRRLLIRKLVIGEAIGERPRRGLTPRTSPVPSGAPEEPGEE